ncbi:helix-turn-helix domain-containing protein [Azospirillum canadense]|uniref:hypothetical protein n=1 Tax=Azospirillum canadense TaxID=403962 RepID=UPI0022273976|nr:hypothetical protein [Azospirillum canadense]MCW2240946.1 DNA-binding XRE family transcriptional regulator [Azospirillum canadense]
MDNEKSHVELFEKHTYNRSMTNLAILPKQCLAARALLGWDQGDLAERAGIARCSVVYFERAVCKPRLKTVLGIKMALERAGIRFLNEPGPGVVLVTAELS